MSTQQSTANVTLQSVVVYGDTGQTIPQVHEPIQSHSVESVTSGQPVSGIHPVNNENNTYTTLETATGVNTLASIQYADDSYYTYAYKPAADMYVKPLGVYALYGCLLVCINL